MVKGHSIVDFTNTDVSKGYINQNEGLLFSYERTTLPYRKMMRTRRRGLTTSPPGTLIFSR
jgi:hypothetical protein